MPTLNLRSRRSERRVGSPFKAGCAATCTATRGPNHGGEISRRTAIALGATVVALGVGAAAWAVVSSGTPIPAPQATATRGHVPKYVSRCLAKPEADRGACFAAASRGQVPGYVGRCLAKHEAARGACFAAAAGGHVPGFVSRCLAKPDAARGACFAGARP